MKRHNVNSKGDRLDLYLLGLFPDISRSKIQSLIKSKQILVDGKSSKSSYILKGSEIILYEIIRSISPNNKEESILFEKMELDILHEDKNIIVINKKAGLVVHPGAGNLKGTLLNGLIDRIDTKLFDSTPGIVHRLDKETSGVMIVAKNYKSHSFISKQFEKREVKKIYNALVWGRIKDSGVIEGNMTRNNKNRKIFRMTEKDGRFSKTIYNLLDAFGPFSYLELLPETGRTHQIRVHMKSVGHPIVSDTSYSGGKSMIKSFHVKYSHIIKRVLKLMDRVALHAQSIEIVNPSTMRKEKYLAPTPNDLKNTINMLSNHHESL